MCLLSFKENDASMQIATISLEFWHYEQCVLKKNDTTFFTENVKFQYCWISVFQRSVLYSQGLSHENKDVEERDLEDTR